MDFKAIQKNDKVKVCRWRLDDNCIKVSTNQAEFAGACCLVCKKYKNEVYYREHRDKLLNQAKTRYLPRERPKQYKQKQPKLSDIDEN
jgi:hypothetical protein